MLEVEVGVDVNHWIVANIYLVVVLLDSVLPQSRGVVGCVVLGEVTYVGTEVALEHPGNLEAQEKIGIYVELRYRQHVIGRRFLIGDHVLPVERP